MVSLAASLEGRDGHSHRLLGKKPKNRGSNSAIPPPSVISGPPERQLSRA